MNRMLIVIAVVSTAAACSPGPTAEDAGTDDGGGNGDADVVADADAAVDARTDVDEAEPDADEPEPDADEPEPDAGPAACSAEVDQGEISPWPATAAMPRIAEGPGGYAAVWLQGEEEPFDVAAVLLDERLTPVSGPTVLAMSREQATSPGVIWTHGAWVVVWGDGSEATRCTPDDCPISLNLARLTETGDVMTPPRPIWAGQRILGRPVIVPTDEGAVVAVTVDQDGIPRTSAGRLDADGSPIGALATVIRDLNARGTTPAAAAVGDRVVIVGAVVGGGLVAVAIQSNDAVLAAGPTEITPDRSASSPAAASGGENVGIVYLSTAGGGSSIDFVRLSGSLEPVGEAVSVSSGAVWPRDPVLEAAGDHWVAVWRDGRNDVTADCTASGFCRNDIFVVPVMAEGAAGGAFEVSDDPHDCSSASVAARGGDFAVAWLTMREERPTAFARLVRCE